MEEDTQIGAYPTWGKNSKNPFPKKKSILSFIILLLVLAGLFYLSYLIAYAALTDNFDSYTAGDLTGQGGWSGNVAYDVQTSVASSTPNAVANASGPDLAIANTITSQAAGIQSFNIRTTSTARDGQVQICSAACDDTKTIISGRMVGNPGNVDIVRSGGVDVLISGYSANTWYQIELEWGGPSGSPCTSSQVRGRANGGAWTACASPQNAFTSATNIRIISDPSSSTFYFDNFLDNTPVVAAGGLSADEDYIVPFLMGL